jgi:protein-S-isoprenylcysteine O-methyltransferase Ste14
MDHLVTFALTLCVACFASFTWSILRLFQQRIGMVLRAKILSALGFVFFLAQVWAITRSHSKASASSVAGLLLYLLALCLFWWAVPYARRACLSIAFTPSQPATLMILGPFKYVRHPFYLSYLGFWVAGVFVSRNLGLVIPVVVMGMFYWGAIRQEEGEFGRGSLRNEYRQYKSRTGSLIPRFKENKIID